MNARTAKVARLVDFLCDGVESIPGEEELDRELGDWLGASRRFLAFAEFHATKIRKKLRTATEPGPRGDVLAELETAFLLLGDRRFDLAFEAYGSGRKGPDFTVTFRSTHRFNLEVTRPRAGTGEGAIAGPLLGKLRQLPVDASNAILLAGGLARSAGEVESMVRALKLRADRGDEEFFAARRLSAKEFQDMHRRMALLMVGRSEGDGVHVWKNPEARRPLPDGAANACIAALSGARRADGPAPATAPPSPFPPTPS